MEWEGQEHMVPQQQGNRMLAHGIDRLENCMELLEESNGNKRPGQASKDSLASPASFLAGSFFQSWLSRLNAAQVSQGHSLTSYAGETWWQSGPNHSSWRSSRPAVGQTEGTWGVAKQTRLHWRKYVGHTRRFHHSRSFGTRSTSLQKLSKKTRRDCPMRDIVRLQNALKEHTPTMLLRLCWRIRLSKHKHWERRLATMFLKARVIHCLKLLLDLVLCESRHFKSRVR